jgi:hypothetical protein
VKKLIQTLLTLTIIFSSALPNAVMAKESQPPIKEWWNTFFGNPDEVNPEYYQTWPEKLCDNIQKKNLGTNISFRHCNEVFTSLGTSSAIFAISIADVVPGDEAVAGAMWIGDVCQAGKVIFVLVLTTQGENIQNGMEVALDELALLTNTATITPPVVWPEWDPDVFGHAIEQRDGLFKTFLAYQALSHTADSVYYAPHSGKILVTTYDPYVGTIAGIFLGPDPTKSDTITLEKPVTILLGTQGAETQQIRVSSCMTWEVFPILQYDPAYEPFNQGRCLDNGN